MMFRTKSLQRMLYISKLILARSDLLDLIVLRGIHEIRRDLQI